MVEQLDPGDASTLGPGLRRVPYTSPAAVPGATEKAVADAGSVAVTRLA